MEESLNLSAQGLEIKADFAAERHNRSDELIVRTGESIIASIESLAVQWEMSTKPRRQSLMQMSQDLRRPAFAIEKIVLRSLLYTTINDRHEAIAAAHARTFQWIFKDPKLYGKPWDSFIHWLRSESDIYWINGKAASGKSTLMKFLCAHPETHKHLALWAHTTPLICAHFFFWNTGTPLQKSQAGLLRSLLHQALSQHMELVPRLLPELCNMISLRTDDFLRDLPETWHSWSLVQLQHLLRDLFRLTATAVKFCFFIDGLDEFDGDHLEIASFLSGLSVHPNVKICLSSRPLMSFEHEFETCPKICLQNLTVADIRLYVHEKLHEHKRMSKLQHTNPDMADALVEEIVKMSSGVFLWVTIATRSLLEGLTNLDDISDLQKRLRELPPELNDLFSLMLKSIKPSFYLEQGSRLFQIVYHARSPLSVHDLSVADNEEASHHLPVDVVTAAISARLKSRCAGLLEVQTGGIYA